MKHHNSLLQHGYRRSSSIHPLFHMHCCSRNAFAALAPSHTICRNELCCGPPYASRKHFSRPQERHQQEGHLEARQAHELLSSSEENPHVKGPVGKVASIFG